MNEAISCVNQKTVFSNVLSILCFVITAGGSEAGKEPEKGMFAL